MIAATQDIDTNEKFTGGSSVPHPEREAEDKKVIRVLVNEKSVGLVGKSQTGLSIKHAAIAQGVGIQLDFVLSIERGNGRTELVGDNEPIKIREGERFLAIPNDDNS